MLFYLVKTTTKIMAVYPDNCIELKYRKTHCEKKVKAVMPFTKLCAEVDSLALI